jgi:hypothetical protein
MKLSPFLNLFGIIESITPFHLLSLGLTFISTVSFSAMMIKFIEPVKHVYFNLLLTFPLTIGLIIILILLINTNWHKVTFLKIISTPLLFALLFAGLNLISQKFELEKTGAANEIEATNHNTDHPDKKQTVKVVQPMSSDQALSHLNEATDELNHHLLKRWVESIGQSPLYGSGGGENKSKFLVCLSSLLSSPS